MPPEQLKLLKDIYDILVPSQFAYAVYVPPAQSMRNAADEIERKEMLISQFKKELYFWEHGKYPEVPTVSHINIVGNGTTTIPISGITATNEN